MMARDWLLLQNRFILLLHCNTSIEEYLNTDIDTHPMYTFS